MKSDNLHQSPFRNDINIVDDKFKITVGSSNIKNNSNFMNESTQDYVEPSTFWNYKKSKIIMHGTDLNNKVNSNDC